MLGIGFLGLMIGCLEEAKETETEETTDLTAYCNEDETQNLLAEDGDCDGILTAEDCDDADDLVGSMSEDADCDGVLTADDCDDSDAASTVVSEDADCDGVLTADDCDDADPESTLVSEDADCDAALDVEECDGGTGVDTDTDGDCDDDGIVSDADCDDNDAESTVLSEDGDCDGILTGDDCDDSNPGLLAIANDADCDGVVFDEDCDDADATNVFTLDDPACEESVNGVYITQNWSGSGTVNNGTYIGTESFAQGENAQAGTGVLDKELVYDLSGTTASNPTDCTNCVFTFDISATFLPNQSIDPNSEGIDMNFSYALGVNAYGANTLWYGSSNTWYEFLVDGTEQTDLAGTIFTTTVTFDGTNFSYDQGLVDFYYYY